LRSLSRRELEQLSVADLLKILKPLGVEKPLYPNTYLTVKQVAALLGVHSDTVRRNYSDIFDRLSPGRIGVRVSKLFGEIARQKAA
jgi:hypothetical protein